MTRLTKSQPVALLGEAPPRVLVEPKGALANSWEDVADLSAQAGIVLDGWQELILRAAMGERRDNTWAAKRVGVTVPRQNGKSQLLVARALAGAVLFGEKKIVISAHQQDTAREAFNKLVEILEDEGNGWLMDRVRPKGIMNAINREQVKFRNGATIQFKARSGAAGKGFSSDCLMLDEAQILSQRAWVSINSTMSAMQNPQVWLLGTSPQREDDSEVFESIRSAAVEGRSTAAAWCEWGADVKASDYDPASEYTRWSANPAWNTRINHEVVDGEFETYPKDKFAQDRLGVWVDDVSTARRWSSELWKSAEVESAPADGIRSFAVAFSFDGTRVSVAGSVKHADGVHVELIAAHSGATDSGVDSLAGWLAGRVSTTAAIVIIGAAGAALKQALADLGVGKRVVSAMSTPDYFAANSMTEDALKGGTVTHPVGAVGDVLDASVAVSDIPKADQGTWRWKATVPDGDETPVEAFCAAYWAARTSKRTPGRKAKVTVM